MRFCFIVLICGLTVWFAAPLAAAQDPLFTGVQLSAQGEVSLRLATSGGAFYRLEVSEDLFTWQGWITGRGTGTDVHVDGGSVYVPSRFYRALPLTGSEHLTGDHLPTENGEVTFHIINHASLVLRWNGLMIYNDPVGSSSLYTGLAKANLILVSHDHSDHYNSGTLGAVRDAQGVIVCPAAVYGRLSTLQSAAVSLPNGGVTNLMGATIEAIPAYNSRHTRGAGNGYVVSVGGIRIYFSGDTEDVAEMRALSDIDVAFICMNVPFTMTVDQAASAVRQFRPRIVYPYHYRNQDGSLADLARFKQLVGTDAGVEVRIRDWY